MNDPIIISEQADRYGVRIRLEREIDRVATAVWWGRYTVEDALQDIRGMAFIVATKMKINTDMIDGAVVEWLDEELSNHEAAHTDSLHAMTEAGLIALRAGGTRGDVRKAIALCAADRPKLPPTHIMDAAVEAAAQQHRRAEYWWRKRETAE